MKKSKKIVWIGAILLFVSLLIFVGYLLAKVNKIRKFVGQAQTSENSKNLSLGNSDSQSWDIYTNTDFNFKIEIPQLLYKREFKDQGRYMTFVRFEENQFSKDKGVALGVTEEILEEEVRAVKEEIEKEGGKLAKEEDLEVASFEAKRLFFEPEKEGEARVVVIFNDNKNTYSISTVPEQIDRVVESFKFL